MEKELIGKDPLKNRVVENWQNTWNRNKTIRTKAAVLMIKHL